MADVKGSIGELGVKLVADTTGFSPAMMEALKQTATVQSAMSALGIIAGQALVGGFRMAVSAITDYIKGLDEAAKANKRFAMLTGAPGPKGEGLQTILQGRGLTRPQESLTQQMTQMMDYIASSKPGSAQEKKLAEFARSAGVTLKDFKGMDASQQYEIISSAFTTIKDKGQQVQVAKDIFGRGGWQDFLGYGVMTQEEWRREGEKRAGLISSREQAQARGLGANALAREAKFFAEETMNRWWTGEIGFAQPITTMRYLFGKKNREEFTPIAPTFGQVGGVRETVPVRIENVAPMAAKHIQGPARAGR